MWHEWSEQVVGSGEVPQHFDFLDMDPQKYGDPRGKILIKKCKKKKFTLETQIWAVKNGRLSKKKIFLLNCLLVLA